MRGIVASTVAPFAERSPFAVGIDPTTPNARSLASLATYSDRSTREAPTLYKFHSNLPTPRCTHSYASSLLLDRQLLFPWAQMHLCRTVDATRLEVDLALGLMVMLKASFLYP